MSARISFATGLVTLGESIALSSDAGSSVIGTLRMELEKEGLLSLSKLDLITSPLVLRGDKISMEDRDEVRLGGGGGGGGSAALLDVAVGVILSVDGIDVDD
jgi:hypothetical protein